MYEIGGKKFNSRSELETECRRISAEYQDKIVQSPDLDWLLAFFIHHPEWPIKSRKMAYIKSELDQYRTNYCFYIYQTNGIRDDISWSKIIGYIPVDLPKMEFIIPFGKYKDQSIYDIDDRGYLIWLSQQDWISYGVKIRLNQFLRLGYVTHNQEFYNRKKNRSSHKNKSKNESYTEKAS